ncbi:UNKNOWN [Stylonychia lemnae]|uniref:C2HC/C3H-type domain-containing protein n=1 Tax=Stylonychia lemnae TaxID=5949 RepID=A0A078A979_STYLE|nr:UNKNOWN [Stylonychia lemnae]|eukprot:CDW78396.1 UNKNOWN [Stylonychia lemnae]
MLESQDTQNAVPNGDLYVRLPPNISKVQQYRSIVEQAQQQQLLKENQEVSNFTRLPKIIQRNVQEFKTDIKNDIPTKSLRNKDHQSRNYETDQIQSQRGYSREDLKTARSNLRILKRRMSTKSLNQSMYAGGKVANEKNQRDQGNSNKKLNKTFQNQKSQSRNSMMSQNEFQDNDYQESSSQTKKIVSSNKQKTAQPIKKPQQQQNHQLSQDSQYLESDEDQNSTIDFEEFKRQELLKLQYIRQRDKKVLKKHGVVRKPQLTAYRVPQEEKTRNLKESVKLSLSATNNKSPQNTSQNLDSINNMILNGGIKLPRLGAQLIEKIDSRQSLNQSLNQNLSTQQTSYRRVNVSSANYNNGLQVTQYSKIIKDRPFKIQRIIQDKNLLQLHKQRINQSSSRDIIDEQKHQDYNDSQQQSPQKQQISKEVTNGQRRVLNQSRLKALTEESNQGFSQYDLKSIIGPSRTENYSKLDSPEKSNQKNGKQYSQYDLDKIQEDEYAGDSNQIGDRIECPSCQRKFIQEAYEKHIKVCQKVFMKKRKVFNARKQRQNQDDSPHDKYKQPSSHQSQNIDHNQRQLPLTFENKKLQNKAKQGVSNKRQQQNYDESQDGHQDITQRAGNVQSKKSGKWKYQSETFRRNLKAARGVDVNNEFDKSTNFRGVHNQYSEEADDRILCQYCSRKFNQNAADRHIPVCQQKYKQDLIKNRDNNAKSRSKSRGNAYGAQVRQSNLKSNNSNYRSNQSNQRSRSNLRSQKY